MSDVVPTAGMMIVCDRYGTILHGRSEEVYLADRFVPGQAFAALVDEESCEKARLFLTLLQTQGVAVDWELNVLVNGQLVPLYCAGSATTDGLVIVGARSRSGMIYLYKELLNKHVQAVIPSETEPLQHAYARAEHESDLYNELSRLNNELVTLHRELTKKNIELRTQREWFRGTLSSIGDAVLATDPDGHVTFLNAVAQALTGWQQEDAIGQPFTEVLHIITRETRQPAEAPIREVLREGEVTALVSDVILITKTGTEIPIDDSAAPIKDDNGGLLGVVIVFRDVTARAQFEEALQRANDQLERRVQERTAKLARANRALQTEIMGRKRAESKLLESERLAAIGMTAAKLAHEIGNPLNGMYTTIQLLERDVAKQAGP